MEAKHEANRTKEETERQAELEREVGNTLHKNYELLRWNPPDVGVTSGQKPCTKIIYIVLQTSVGLF